MQVNSVSSVQSQALFGNKISQREVLKAFANADDMALKQAALEKASIDVNDKKHKRVSNALYLSLAPAIGLATLLKQPPLASKLLNPRAAKLATFGVYTLGAGVALAAVDLVLKGVKKLENSNGKLNEFAKEHPTMSFLGTLGAGIGALTLVTLGGYKLKNVISPKLVGAKVEKFATKLNSLLDNSKVLNKLSKGLAKVPSAIKGFTKGLINWSPILIALSSINHSFAHARAKGVAYANNYTQLKDAQAQVRVALANEEVEE